MNCDIKPNNPTDASVKENIFTRLIIIGLNSSFDSVVWGMRLLKLYAGKFCPKCYHDPDFNDGYAGPPELESIRLRHFMLNL